MARSTQEAFQRGTDTFNAHDLEGFAGVLADDVVFAAPGDQRQGQSGLRRVLRRLVRRLPQRARRGARPPHPRRRRRRGRNLHGTHYGVLHAPAGDIPPTGCPVSIDYIQVLRFRNGEHTSFNLSFDRLLMLEQLRLVPAPSA